MKKLILLIVCLSISAHLRADADTKKMLINEYVKLQGIDEVVNEAKGAVKKQADEMMEKMFAQITTNMPGLPNETWDVIRAAADRMMGKLITSWSADEAIDIVRELYAKDFSEDEIRLMINEAKTPFGQKQIATAKRASSGLQKFIMDRSKTALDSGIKEYIQELQQIVTKATAAPAK